MENAIAARLVDTRWRGKEGRPAFLDYPEWHDTVSRLRLSRREGEVVECVLALCDNDVSIAEALAMSRHTVHTHLERLYRKLNVNNRCQLIVRVLLVYSDVVRANAGGQPKPRAGGTAAV